MIETPHLENIINFQTLQVFCSEEKFLKFDFFRFDSRPKLGSYSQDQIQKTLREIITLYF